MHKGMAGCGLLVAGSRGMYGAALLGARAAMRMGMGLLYVQLPSEAASGFHRALPESMVIDGGHPTRLKEIHVPAKAQAVAIGPGLGRHFPCAAALKRFLQEAATPLPALVLDADALHLLGNHPALVDDLPPETLLTPHEGELRHWVGPWRHDREKLDKAQALAEQIKGVVLLKGAHTVIFSPTQAPIFNATGNAGMATAGSGDVLTGILLALRASGCTAIQAAQLGAFLHGAAGDEAARKKGMHALIASDIIEALPVAIRRLGYDQTRPRRGKRRKKARD